MILSSVVMICSFTPQFKMHGKGYLIFVLLKCRNSLKLNNVHMITKPIFYELVVFNLTQHLNNISIKGLKNKK